MDEVTHRNFGLTIAYILPGFVSLWGVSYFCRDVAMWIATAPQASPSIGAFLYGILGSLALGLIISAIRWATIDTANEHTGLKRPKLDYSKLQENLQAFDNAVEYHYRYYQFYSNMVVALLAAFVARCVTTSDGMSAYAILGFLFVEAVLFAGARDALGKYYERLTDMLGAEGPRSSSAKTAVKFGDEV